MTTTDLEQHTLTYPGKVDAPVDRLLGPGLDGRLWRVIGSMYDAEEHRTFVTVEAFQGVAARIPR